MFLSLDSIKVALPYARPLLGISIGVGLLSLSIIAGIIGENPNNFGPFQGSIQYISSRPGVILADLFRNLPFGFAFLAGLTSAVNPCGFAMLPAYLGLYISTASGNGKVNTAIWSRGYNVLLISSTITLGFLLVFGITGLIIALGFRWIIGYMPWFAIIVGVGLISLGAWIFAGGKIYTNMPISLGSNMKTPHSIGLQSYFIFGLAYAMTSLGCTLPIFLLVIGTTLTSSNMFMVIIQFLLYSIGMGVVILFVTASLSLFKGTVIHYLRSLRPLVDTISSLLIMLAGAYIIVFWISLGNLL